MIMVFDVNVPTLFIVSLQIYFFIFFIECFLWPLKSSVTSAEKSNKTRIEVKVKVAPLLSFLGPCPHLYVGP